MRRLIVATTVAVLALPAGAAATQAGDEGPLQTAGRAAEQTTFEGTLRVRWSDGFTDHSDVLTVQGANGSVVVKGGASVMASPHQRLVEHGGGVWDLLWPTDEIGSGRPPADDKYDLVDASPTVVSGRSARVVEVRQGGVLLERLALDQVSGLLLRREQFENGADPTRTVEFETIKIGGPTPAPNAPRMVVNATPKVVAPLDVPSSVSAPHALVGGYQRIGLYRRSGVTQVLYSDGLYDLSVFQQSGRLDRDHLPAGAHVKVAPSNGVGYAWPGGHVIVWAASGTVYTAVSDAPLVQLLAAVRSMPLATGTVSLLRRLRQVCRSLIQPLA